MDNNLQELIGDPEKEQALIRHEVEVEETKLLNEIKACGACSLEYKEKCPNGCQDTNRSGILII